MRAYLIIAICVAVGFDRAACFVANWGMYPQVSSHHVLPSVSAFSVVFRHPEFQGQSIQLTFRQKIAVKMNGYNSSELVIGDSLRMTTQSHGSSINLSISITESNSKEQYFTVQTNIDAILKPRSTSNFKQICKLQTNPANSNNLKLYQCRLHINQTKLLVQINNGSAESIPPLTPEMQEAKISNFMEIYRIERNQLNTQAVQTAITSMMNSICLFGGQFTARLGLCDGSAAVYEFKLSALAIAVLADYDYGLAECLAMNYMNELEVQVMYQRDASSQIMPIPEFLDFFKIFMDTHSPLKGAQILNSIFSKLMLNQITHLHEQLNYRQAKKLHPYLMQMLTQPWTTNHQLNQFKSIYTQSFTEDYRYHDYGHRLSQCITKNSWIYNAIETSLSINKHVLKQSRKSQQINEQTIQYTTLLDLYKTFIDGETKSKIGSYLDVFQQDNHNRFYTKFFGYGSVLPYVYGAGDALPLETIKQLSSAFGLKSSTQAYNNETAFRFRGNVHAYFNYRILRGVKVRLIKSKVQKHKQHIQYLNGIWKSVQKTVKHQFETMRTISTSWSSKNGESREECGWLQIVSVLFLGEF